MYDDVIFTDFSCRPNPTQLMSLITGYATSNQNQKLPEQIGMAKSISAMIKNKSSFRTKLFCMFKHNWSTSKILSVIQNHIDESAPNNPSFISINLCIKYTIIYNNLDLLKSIMEIIATPNLRILVPAFTTVLEQENIEIASWLLEMYSEKIDPAYSGENYKTFVRIVIFSGNIAIYKVLVKLFPKFNYEYYLGNAKNSGNISLYEYMLSTSMCDDNAATRQVDFYFIIKLYDAQKYALIKSILKNRSISDKNYSIIDKQIDCGCFGTRCGCLCALQFLIQDAWMSKSLLAKLNLKYVFEYFAEYDPDNLSYFLLGVLNDILFDEHDIIQYLDLLIDTTLKDRYHTTFMTTPSDTDLLGVVIHCLMDQELFSILFYFIDRYPKRTKQFIKLYFHKFPTWLIEKIERTLNPTSV